MEKVSIHDTFWTFYQKLVKDTVIPYQYAVLNDELAVNVEAERKDDQLPAGKSHALENFRIAAGQANGEHFGWFFQDSDVYKWLEAAAYSLENYPDAQLEAVMDEVIVLIGQAQEKDGYLNTFFQLKSPELKYRQLYFSHELYCAGHLIEAAIAYAKVTGKENLLEIALKVVANIQAHFGKEEGKIQGADGHQEIELALGKLYEYTKKEEYLELAKFFLNVRGQDTAFYDKQVQQNLGEGLSEERPQIDLVYLQAYTQPKNQETAEGHAVRMLYMAAGMAKIAHHMNDEELYAACLKIWTNIVGKKLYITGGVGSTVHGEAFTGDYDLPNDTMYCETCAAIALVYFAYELFKIDPKVEYIDVMERALYNCVLAGAAVDGKHFFYVNPLEVHPDQCHHNPGKGHVKTQRPDWLGCACCPPNFARTIASLEQYIYTTMDHQVYINLYIASELQTETFHLKLITDFPYENQVTIEYQGPKQKIYLRKPYWAENLASEGKFLEEAGYLILNLEGDAKQTFTFEQPILSITSNPLVVNNLHKVAWQKGPFVYCAEGIDNGENIHLFSLPTTASQVDQMITSEILEKTLKISVETNQVNLWQTKALYQFSQMSTEQKCQLTLIPYHLWGNRGETEMQVWFHQK